MIGIRMTSASLGRTWLRLVNQILREGTPMGEEGLEMLGTRVAFAATTGPDPILDRFADPRMVSEMKKVFFSDAPNSLGHSYAKLICGPDGRHDLQDIISLLSDQPQTKRALVTFSNPPGGKVPCVNAVQFLVRNRAVQLMYFARGQDAFRKFYADALCLSTMAETVAAALQLEPGLVTGFIGSSHIYHSDMPALQDLLASSKHLVATEPEERALA
jgi:thymidylate synthase